MSFESEARETYERARKRGLKELNVRKARMENGYLPVLDARREECGVLAYAAQPARAISLARLVGTYQSSRSVAFASNFMPILPPGTEFAGKWIALCRAHLASGIVDPIRVYEYLWRYYVAEGNKRVSVLKYYGSTSYDAEITRLIPQYDESDPDIVRYYTFLSYAKKGLFSDIELSQPKKYERLYRIEQRLLGELGDAPRPKFDAMYTLFESAYLTTNCTLTLGDAFLEYLHVYGFPMNILLDELAQRIVTLKPQLELLEHQAEPRIVLNEAEAQAETPLFSRLLTHRNPKIIFAYTKGRTETNWLGAHERGRLAMQEALGERVSSYVIDGLDRDNAYERLCEEASDAGLVFVTSPSMMNAVLRFALERPNVTTLVYSRMLHHFHLHTYFGRYYEAVFVCGAAAGLATRSGVVAYVTPQISGVRYTSDINAFAIGVRSVRPDARVLLVTKGVAPLELGTCVNGLRVAAGMGADVALTPRYEAMRLSDVPDSVFSVLVGMDETGEPNRYLAAPDWNWDCFYTAIVRSYLNGGLGALLSEERAEPSVTGFWWGIGAGVVDVRFGECASGPSMNLLRYLRGSIARNQFHPFHGPVAGCEGEIRVQAHTDARPLEIANMKYLVEPIEVIEDAPEDAEPSAKEILDPAQGKETI